LPVRRDASFFGMELVPCSLHLFPKHVSFDELGSR
jgi:hypothetical protein